MRTRTFCLFLLFCALSVCVKAQGYYYMALDEKKILLVAEGYDLVSFKYLDTIKIKKGEFFNPMLFPGLWAQLDADDKKVLGIEAARKEEDIIVLQRAGVANLYKPTYSSISKEEDRQKEIDRYIAKHYTVYIVPAPSGDPWNPIAKGKYPYLKPGVLSGKVKPGSNTSTATSKTNVASGNVASIQSRAETGAIVEIDGIIKELAALFKKVEGFTYYDSKNKENLTYLEQTFTKDLIVQRIKYKSTKEDVLTYRLTNMPWLTILSASVVQTGGAQNENLYHVHLLFNDKLINQVMTTLSDPTPTTDSVDYLILEIKKEDVENATRLVEKLKAASKRARREKAAAEREKSNN